MKWWCVFVLALWVCGSGTAKAQEPPVPVIGQQIAVPAPQTGAIAGTVTDAKDGPVAGATVVLDGPAPGERHKAITDDEGVFELENLEPGTPYVATINAPGFAPWISPAITLEAGQRLILSGAKLQIAEARTTVTVFAYSEEIATEQVKIEEQQRVFGIIPNFYITYDPHALRLTTKLKFRLAFRVAFDPVTIIGAGAVAGIDQAADFPHYGQGAKGYGQRFGTVFTDSFTDTMIGGAILPSLLRQDPRYFYKGTGTIESRALYALSQPFICKGDNGRWQANYSSMGGDLASSALSNTYYPAANRGTALVFENFLINTGDRMASTLIQEFFLRWFTTKGKK
jgi:hypothetical protein